MASTRIESLRSPEQLADLREAWNELWERCPDATPFQSPEWLLPWWEHLGRGRLHGVALRRGRRLVGLAPFFRTHYFGLPLRRLCLLGTGNTDYLDVLLDPTWAQQEARYVLAELAGGAHFLDLQQLRPESPLLSAAGPSGFAEHRFVQEVCPALDLPPDVSAFQAALPARLRGNLRYYRRRLEREGYVLDTAREDTLNPYLEALFDLHQARWKRRRLPGVFASGKVRSFHRAAAAGFLRRGWLRLHVLRRGEMVVAALYCFTCRGRTYYYAGGFDPDLSALSPGTVLTGYAMEDAIRSGARTFDFLRGDEPYKYRWGATDRPNHRRLLWKEGAAVGMVPVLVNWEHRVEQRIKRLARKWG